jgi:hypothetical protein
MSSEVDCLHNIAVSIMQTSKINVIIDNTMETAMTDYKNIYVTEQLVPPELRKFRRVVSRVLDGEVAHECVKEGTPILTRRGLLPIEQITVGDFVLGNRGWTKVLKTYTRDYEGELVGIHPTGILPIWVTPNHPIKHLRLERQAWKNAEFLKKGDYVYFPRFTHTAYVFDNDYMEFLGFYVGDGYTDSKRYRTTITLESLEKADYLLKKCLKIFGYGRITRHQRLFEVNVDNKGLSLFLKENFGSDKGRAEKVIPTFVMEASKENIESFFKGYFFADGSTEVSGAKRITTISTDCALKLQKMISKTGKRIRINHQKRKGKMFFKGRLVAIKNRYAITEAKEDKRHHNSVEMQNGYWLKIRKTEREQYKGKVCNLHTEDETYEINNILTHNSGHIVVTAPVKERLKQWITHQHNPNLANIVHQCLEDKRVNHYILQRYRFDFAFRLQLLADVHNRLWLDTLKINMAAERNVSAANAMKPESFFLERNLIPISAMEGLWHLDMEKEFLMTDEQKEFVRNTAKIFDDARFDKMVMSIVGRHQQLYDLWEEQVDRKGEQPERNCPKSVGGELVLVSGQATKKAIAKIEKALKEAEEKAEAEAKKEGKGKQSDKTMAAGTGSGLNIPTPEPNEREYQQLVQRNREHIERLLDLLKKLVKPKLMTDKWRKQGRFMTEILGKAFASSQRRNVQDVYSTRTMQLEKAEACIGLLVDLSGSVSEEDAKDSLTVIAEVCGRWLRDEDFAIMVFGSDYQKIKAFVEPYHTTRVRIGGVQCMGGTELYAPLNEMYQMMKAQRNSRAKILMIVSDFYVSRADKCQELIKTVEADNISVIGLGIDSANEARIKEFCKRAKYIGNIRELPEAVFSLYREAAF